MEHELSLSGWRLQWLNRTSEELNTEMSFVFLAVGIVALIVTSSTLYRSIKQRKALESNPSDRAAILAKNDKEMHKSTRCLFYLSHIYLYHALAVWLIDAGIGVFAIAQDVDSNPEAYDAYFWLSLACQSVAMLGIFTFVFMLFPMFQMVAMGYVMARSSSCSADGTMASYMTPARILTSVMAHMWSATGFLIVLYWPVLEGTTARVLILEAVFGSAITWLHASYLFNFCGNQLAQVEIDQIMGIRDGILLYSKQVYVVHTSKSQSQTGLPQHEVATETAPLISEKPAQ